MSTADNTPSRTKTPRRLQPSIERQGECQDIDKRLDHLNKQILPISPYYLTVPSKPSYHLDPSQKDNWRAGQQDIWDSDEEQLQYATFLSRNSDDTLLESHEIWILQDEPKSRTREGRSGTTTPAHGPTKKISLAEYKKQKLARDSAGGTPLPQSNMAKDNSSNGVARSSAVPKSTAPSEASTKGKRSAETMDELISRASNSNEKYASKRARLTPPPTKPTKLGTAKRTENATTERYELPPYLSPTLPQQVEEQLAQFEKLPPPKVANSLHKKTLSNTSSSSDALTHVPSRAHDSEARGQNIKAPTPRHVAAGSAPVAKSVEGKPAALGLKRPPTITENSAHRGAGASFFDSIKNPSSRASPAVTLSKSSGVVKPASPPRGLVVKLKYGRSNRKAVQRLLNMKPSPKKTDRAEKILASDGKLRVQEDVNLKDRQKDKDKETSRSQVGDADKSRPQKTGDKRPRLAEVEHGGDAPLKRQRVPESLDTSKRPMTPIPAAFKSPALSNPPSVQKSRGTTPMKDVKGAAMRRIDSSESFARTPLASRAEVNESPNGLGKSDGKAKAQAQVADGEKGKEAEAWRHENKKLSELARSIKHEAQKILIPLGDGEILEDHLARKGAVIYLESVLCYFLAFAADDEARRLTRPGSASNAWRTVSWRTLLPLWEFVERKCRQYSALHGLCLQLGALCREAIHSHDMDRFHTEPLPDIAAASRADEAVPPTPGAFSDSNGSEKDGKAAAYKRNYVRWKAEMMSNSQELRRLWVAGIAALPAEDLRLSFPRSWAKASKAPPARSSERVAPGKYRGGYYLPLSSVTPAVEAVRAATALLKEWCKGEGVDWASRLGV
ncbi:MAG: hypothetical protein M1825_004468 [Sarcosagium campestre]|nr:MAG: hypothetical protein M1825_004468 [Sarcosagium campestre]